MENRKQHENDAQTLADVRLPEARVKEVEEQAAREEEQSSEDNAAGTT